MQNKIYTYEEITYMSEHLIDFMDSLIVEMIKFYTFDELVTGEALDDINLIKESFYQEIIVGLGNCMQMDFSVQLAISHIKGELTNRYVFTLVDAISKQYK